MICFDIQKKNADFYLFLEIQLRFHSFHVVLPIALIWNSGIRSIRAMSFRWCHGVSRNNEKKGKKRKENQNYLIKCEWDFSIRTHSTAVDPFVMLYVHVTFRGIHVQHLVPLRGFGICLRAGNMLHGTNSGFPFS